MTARGCRQAGLLGDLCLVVGEAERGVGDLGQEVLAYLVAVYHPAHPEGDLVPAPKRPVVALGGRRYGGEVLNMGRGEQLLAPPATSFG